MRPVLFTLSLLLIMASSSMAQRPRDLGIIIGVMEPGAQNSITDVPGVTIGHSTLIQGDDVRTGVTAILPHQGNLFQQKVPAAIHIGNGFGKLAGYSQVKELGNIETPIILTNTLSVPAASNALITYTLKSEENKGVRSVNPVVGETNDGRLNDIRGRHVTEEHVLNAIRNAGTEVKEGNVGAGTGTVCFGFKGGIGTSSRVLPKSLGGYSLGVLVQTNFGGVLEINGVPLGEELGNYYFKDHLENSDGSCMIVLITDAPLDSRNLERLAKRCMLGLAKTGGIASNGSGDYVIAISNYEANLIPYIPTSNTYRPELLHNDQMSPLFMAAIEATEEAIINSLFAAESMTGFNGKEVKALPKDEVLNLMKKYNQLQKK